LRGALYFRLVIARLAAAETKNAGLEVDAGDRGRAQLNFGRLMSPRACYGGSIKIAARGPAASE